MYYLYTSRPSFLFSAEWKGCSFQVSSIVFFILYISTAKPFSLVREYIEVKIPNIPFIFHVIVLNKQSGKTWCQILSYLYHNSSYLKFQSVLTQ